ncbi:putative selenoprotein SelK/SelG [Helianthus annuus]|uniref:Selenoprotein SelK/SelG n=1 Tax=Helianthus annuus TaxID=4232 RepID=A0A9K3DX74_HELAN|nr:putative selenoprotein SelK/SelG [Helianthus annuus]KAJ0444916.1 putative selenoprotein SelK/SelG [Helianthus annuus]KAJ0462122.1 putative selenoprotein SelK/SelG [Helianthus annuus]KAJ0823056.1 putative selenoprotein SelK/SelG [Helianthus annuus]
MAYVEKGVVKSNRSIWRLRTIIDFFWAIINFISVFFVTMFSMEKSDGYKKSSGSSKKWDGGGPGGGPYGGGPRGPPRGLDNVRGIDHSILSSCMWILLWRLKGCKFRYVQSFCQRC